MKLIIIHFFIVMKQFLDLEVQITIKSPFFIDFLKSKSSVYCLLNKTFFSKFHLCVIIIHFDMMTCAELRCESCEQMFWIRHRWESLKRSQKPCLLGKFAPPEHEHRRPEELARVGLVFQGLHWHTHTHTYQQYDCFSPHSGMLWEKSCKQSL